MRRWSVGWALARFAIALGMIAFGRSASGAAANCGQTDQTWVNVRFLGRGWTPKFAESVLAELRTDLARDAIAACADVASAIVPPVAVVEIVAEEPTSVVISILVRDRVTAKRVGRDSDLGSLPPDGRPLAVAAAADELLHVTWAELALRTSHPPANEPPEPVLRAARETLPPPAPAPTSERLELGARASVSRFGGGQTEVGGDGVLRAWLSARIATEISLGGRAALPVHVAHGTLRSRSIVATASLDAAWIQSGPLRLETALGLRAASVTFEPDAVPAVQATSASFTTFGAFAAAASSVRIASSFRLGAGLGLGAPFRSASATDDGVVVSGVNGVELFAHAGFSLGL